MDKRVPHLALVAGWGTFFVPFSGRLVGFRGFFGPYVILLACSR